MKLNKAIESLGDATAKEMAERLSLPLGVDWENGAKYIFTAIITDHTRIPGNMGGVPDDEEEVIKKWLMKYKNGYEARASKRHSRLPGTVADPMVEKIIGARLSNLSEDDLSKITYAHRLAMSAENILGLILEEYLSINLRAYGWHCAWGGTVKSVDFVKENGELLQIKNRSNSENSSSSAVRAGTVIQKWFRVKADRVEYMWDELNQICGTTHLSEESFVEFAEALIQNNPGCLTIENKNPWKDLS